MRRYKSIAEAMRERRKIYMERIKNEYCAGTGSSSDSQAGSTEDGKLFEELGQEASGTGLHNDRGGCDLPQPEQEVQETPREVIHGEKEVHETRRRGPVRKAKAKVEGESKKPRSRSRSHRA